VLTLKRFSYDFKTGRRAKILTPVQYPRSFSLNVFEHDTLVRYALFAQLSFFPLFIRRLRACTCRKRCRH
jgi:hypothetical protein